MVVFPLLASPQTYKPETFDYSQEQSLVTTASWVEVFRKSIPSYVAHCLQDEQVPQCDRQAKADNFSQAFNSLLDSLLQNPKSGVADHKSYTPPITCISQSKARDVCLHEQGFGDIFKGTKEKENEKSMKLLPGVIQSLDSIENVNLRWEQALKGVFSGNLFDWGAAESAKRLASGNVSFRQACNELNPRPWAIDDLDAIVAHLGNVVHEKAILFVDNAGADVVLGMLPLARLFCTRGTQVILAANSKPSINDITADELRTLLNSAANLDVVFNRAVMEQVIKVVPSGSELGVIDLREVSQELADEAADADLVILEGMARAIETNLNACFKCDAICLGMIKHPEVATCLKSRLYDCVCKLHQRPRFPSALKAERYAVTDT